nr:alpha/beta hydrolase [Nitrospinaceae bacterium]NIR54449.1 alpha/beta hydrolase [Nitrospinaceae bacterium]NIS84868.1 alpha/beta hydrolase [Nitrospinaceae bacterium]NIT81680.1 alpha/beta hydrolase [Nitrospinaceae bacterium]NIU43951.1 alpha/beta hydrolase [Nitrospinaceae bacterium]
MKRKTILETLASLAVMLVLFVVLLVGCEKSIIYHPDKYPVGLWQTDQAPVPIEDVWFQAKDGVKLHGWYVPHPEPAASLLFFHGNAGNLSHRLDNILVLQSLRLNIFIFDYRGYGRSEGDPGETGILLDGQAAYDTLMSRPGVSPQKLFIFGRSLGGSFAAQIAAKNPVAGVIIESCFTNASDMADEMLPLLPMRWFISSKFDTLTAVSNLKIPKLFLHGTHDEIIP